jgi:hypothetical protein
VAAAGALILLERYAGVPVVRLRNICRRDPRLVERAEKRAVAAYRSAVRLASRGKAAEALDALDGPGWVREHRPEEGRRHLAQNYLQALNRKERPLVVAQIWNEVEFGNAAVRDALDKANQLDPATCLLSYRTVDLIAPRK